MALEIPQLPFESKISNGRGRIRRVGNYMAVESISGKPAYVGIADNSCSLEMYGPRPNTNILYVKTVSRDGLDVSDLIYDAILMVNGQRNNLIPQTPYIIPGIDLGRGMLFKHPYYPNIRITMSGIGVVRGNERANLVSIYPPDWSMTFDEFFNKRGYHNSGTTIVRPDRSVVRYPSDAGLGVYSLGSEEDLHVPPDGHGTLYGKFRNTELVAFLNGQIALPDILLFGSYGNDDTPNPPSGWMLYISPDSIGPSSLYKLSNLFDKEMGRDEFLFDTAVYDFLSALALVHKNANLTHNQPHAENWRYVMDGNLQIPIYIGDWGTAVDTSSYTNRRIGGNVSSLEKIRGLDASIAITTCTLRQIADTPLKSELSRKLIEKIARTVAFGMAGYNQPSDIKKYINRIYREFSNYVNRYFDKFRKSSPSSFLAIEKLISTFVQIELFN